MATATATATESSNLRRQPSRLQRRAPSSLQINKSQEWNVAIPLLSPVTSPQAPISFVQATSEIDPRKEVHHRNHQASAATDLKPPAVFKKWQAAPFCYEPAPPMPSFVVVDGSRR